MISTYYGRLMRAVESPVYLISDGSKLRHTVRATTAGTPSQSSLITCFQSNGESAYAESNTTIQTRSLSPPVHRTGIRPLAIPRMSIMLYPTMRHYGLRRSIIPARIIFLFVMVVRWVRARFLHHRWR